MGETAKYTDKMSVRHILIVISGIMITFGCSALVFSTWSAFQAVVPEQLGVDTATWALYITVLYLAEAFSAPFIGKLLAKTDIRIVLSVSALLVGLGFILISIVKTLWIFYVAGLMMGLGEVGLLWLAVPTLCNKWFNKNSGTIIGACMAFTGIGGAIWLQVFNALNGFRHGHLDHLHDLGHRCSGHLSSVHPAVHPLHSRGVRLPALRRSADRFRQACRPGCR